MKKMIYKSHHEPKILHSGTYLNHKFVIISKGVFPVAYVENKFSQYGSSKNWDAKFIEDVLNVHGNISFNDFPYWYKSDKHKYVTRYFGWDYAHSGDHYYGIVQPIDKKWTTEEIFEDIIFSINELTLLEAHSLLLWKNSKN